VSHISANLIVPNPLHSQDYKWCNEYSHSCCRTSFPIYRLQINLLHILLHSRLIIASRCISNHTLSRPSSASPNPLKPGLQVHLWVTRSQPPSPSPNSLDHGFQVHPLATRSGLPNASWTPLDGSLQVHLWIHLDFGLQTHPQTYLITATMYISLFTWSRPPSAYLSCLNESLQMLRRLHSSSVCSQIGHMYIYRET